jgi:hypothetical protein
LVHVVHSRGHGHGQVMIPNASPLSDVDDL